MTMANGLRRRSADVNGANMLSLRLRETAGKIPDGPPVECEIPQPKSSLSGLGSRGPVPVRCDGHHSTTSHASHNIAPSDPQEGRATSVQRHKPKPLSKGFKMHSQAFRLKVCTLMIFGCASLWVSVAARSAHGDNSLDQELRSALETNGFTGRIEFTLQSRLGRPINWNLADAGHMLYYDAILAIKEDNACAACHSPTTGYGDTQSIAIGINSNGLVGPSRTGPRLQRRAPSAINTPFYPTLGWGFRFESLSGDPFDNSAGFRVPQPEGLTLSHFSHLLAAVACISVTDRAALVGFKYDGDNASIRATLATRVNGIKRYRKMFGKVYPEVKAGAPIAFDMIANAIAEYELTLIYANAPIDQYARGDLSAMSEDQKRGALLFFGKARCIECHAVSGKANEMFSDFAGHVAAVPQLAPENTNVTFDGPNADEDYGFEKVTHNPDDRYKFRTAPLRNVAARVAYFHNGAFTRLRTAIYHHLNVFESARNYDPRAENIAKDLNRLGPIEPVLARVDPILATPIDLTDDELRQLTEFVRAGLLDERARVENLVLEKPGSVPSKLKPFNYQYPSTQHPAATSNCEQCHY
jgi:cytochrome c peroxidase